MAVADLRAPGGRISGIRFGAASPATDRAAVADFQAFCRETGHALVAQAEDAGVLSFTIRRRADPAPDSPEAPA